MILICHGTSNVYPGSQAGPPRVCILPPPWRLDCFPPRPP